MARRSSRLAKQQNRADHTSKSKQSLKEKVQKPKQPTASINEGSKSEASKRSRKRAKPDTATQQLVLVQPSASKIRGLLQKFAKEAPLDVMLEIFMHLQPRDLLHLSRTSKDLRAILLSKSSAPIWRAVLKNGNLPPLPEDMTEPEYASLAFDSYCDVCGGGPCESISWESRIRCHKTCAVIHLYHSSRLPQLSAWRDGIKEMVELGIIKFVPRFRDIGRVKGRYIKKVDNYFIPCIVDDYRLEFLEVKDDPERLLAWRKEKEAEYKKVLEHDHQCRKWQKWKTAQRKIDLEDLCEERIDRVLKKLVALGWYEDDLEDCPKVIHHPLVNQPKELTDEEWEKIEPTILKVVHKEDVRTQEEMKAYRNRR